MKCIKLFSNKIIEIMIYLKIIKESNVIFKIKYYFNNKLGFTLIFIY